MHSNHLYINLGLKKNPFSKRSSEQEVEFINEIFYEPNYYNTLIDDLVSGDSRFIIGQRGHGKTSIINKLYEDLDGRNNVVIIKIDRYDSIPIKDNERYFLLLIIELLIKNLAICLCKNKHIIQDLDKNEKEALCLFLQNFFRPISNSEFQETYDKIKKIKCKNFIISLWNKYGSRIANNVASSMINISSEFVRRSLGFEGMETNCAYNEYFPRIEEIKIEKKEIATDDFTITQLKNILYKICDLYKKAGFEKVIVLFDKIDECQVLSQDVSKIVNFTRELLSDTELLLNDKISIGFSLWSELKTELFGIVRFDKFGEIDVRWIDANMIPLIDKRLKFFSRDINKPTSFNSLIQSENDRTDIIKLCNKSPRDLIIVLSEIFLEQSNKMANVQAFEVESIRKGMINFCKNYDYDSITLSKIGKNKEVRAMINRLLRLKMVRFTYKDLSQSLNQNDNQSQGQIKIMIGYRLIRGDEILGINEMIEYEIIDPKVTFMIKHLIESVGCS